MRVQMFKQVQKTLFVSVVLFGSLSSAFASQSSMKPFSYRAEIPATDATCDQEATALGQRFAKATGLTVTSSICQSTQEIEKQIVFTVVVNYQNSSPVQPYSAVYTSEGMFGNYVDCLASLPSQQSAFVSNTGLDVLASGCVSASVGNGFSPYVDGLGMPRLHFFSSNPAFESGNTGMVGLYDVFKAQLSAAGATIVMTSTYEIFYYASNPITITTDRVASYRTTSDDARCKAEALSAEHIFGSDHSIAPMVNCLQEEFVGTTYLLVSWPGSAYPIVGDHNKNDTHYNTFSECEQDKDRVVQNNISSGANALGAICEENGSGNGYVIEVFSPVPSSDLGNQPPLPIL
jgi:hypothetical protein